MKIVRTACMKKVEKYELIVDEDYVDHFNATMRGWYNFKDWNDLTYDEFCKIYYDENSPEATKIVHFLSVYDIELRTHEVDLYSLVSDYVNDDLWGNYIETTDSIVEDYDDIQFD